MIKLKHLLNEYILSEEEGDAAEQAHALGLTSAGWGYWRDEFGRTVAQTIDGKLVKFEGHEDAFDEYLNAFTDDVRTRLGLKSFEVWSRPRTGDIHLDSLFLNKEDQGKGKGSAAMEELIKFADDNKKRITLTPAQKDKRHGTTSQSRLIQFYKRFGFVLNKGKSKDYSISDLMYREPKRY